MIRRMTIDDYEEICALWFSIEGFRIRKIDDSKENLQRFLLKNPGLSVVAVEAGKVVGTILCGHDGRVANVYHVCVAANFQRQGIATMMVKKVVEALKKEGITTIHLQAVKQNQGANTFWQSLGWQRQQVSHSYQYELNDWNQIEVVKNGEKTV